MERIFRCSRQMAWRFRVAPLPTSMWDIHGRSRQGSERDYFLPVPIICGLSAGFGAAWSLLVRQLRHRHAPIPGLGTGTRFGSSGHHTPMHVAVFLPALCEGSVLDLIYQLIIRYSVVGLA